MFASACRPAPTRSAAATLALPEGEMAALRLLLARCVRSIDVEGAGPLANVPSALVPCLSKVMAERDPQAEVALDRGVPRLPSSFMAPFDSARFL